jgi:hypothetical protein
MRSFRKLALACLVILPWLASAQVADAGHGHCLFCRMGCPCCCNTCQGPPPAGARDAVDNAARDAAPQAVAPLVSSVPYYAMPVMFTGMPMMPVMTANMQTGNNANRAATDNNTGCVDSTARIEKIENELLRLAKSVNDLQTLVKGQTDVLDAISKGVSPKH